MTEDHFVISVMPGDRIEWGIELSSRAKINHVWATFVLGQGTQDPRRLVLGGRVISFSKTDEGRVSSAVLEFSQEWSDELRVGDYRLRFMNGITGAGASRDFEANSLPDTVIRIEAEPENESLKLGNTHLRTV